MDKWEYAILSHSTGKGWVLETTTTRTQVSDDMLTAMDSAGQQGWQLATKLLLKGLSQRYFLSVRSRNLVQLVAIPSVSRCLYQIVHLRDWEP